jgi:6-phosphogluconolactonase (cycloisomerase 2 family)
VVPLGTRKIQERDMSPKIRSFFICCATIVVALVSRYATAQTDVVYVESNRAHNNSILAFKNNGGTLVLSNEVPTGGEGVFDLSLKLGPFDSDQDLITNAEGTALYAVNSGSDTIAGFRISRSGSLSPLDGSPFPSGGTNPVSIGISRDTLVVVNKAMDPARPDLNKPLYATFSLEPDGRIEAGPLFTSPAPSGSSPSQADISSGKRLVFDAQFLGGHLRSFLLEHDGTLSPQDLQATPGKALPLGLWTHPNKPILYVGFVTVNKLAVYTFDSTGHLQFVRAVANSGKAICWVRTNAAGTRLYTANTMDNSISVYDTTDPLHPTEIQHVLLKGLGNALQFTLGPREDYLYVVTQRAADTIPLGEGNTLHVLKVHAVTGKIGGDSFIKLQVPPGTRPQGVAAVQIR